MASLQSAAMQALHEANLLAETDFDAFKKNIRLSLEFEKAHTAIGSKLTALYTCPKSQIVFSHVDLIAWADADDILAHGVNAESLEQWEDELNFVYKKMTHDDITIMDTKQGLVESLSELADHCDELKISDFITDWKQQVIEQVSRFHH